MCDSAHRDGPRVDVIRVVSVIKFTVMTVCNLPSWEYSGDKPGTRGSKCLCQGAAPPPPPRVPINTPVLCLGTGRLTKLLAFRVKLCKLSPYFPVGSTCLGEQVQTAILAGEWGLGRWSFGGSMRMAAHNCRDMGAWRVAVVRLRRWMVIVA
jgi:hypothetical protein